MKLVKNSPDERIDLYLARELQISRSLAQKYIKEGRVITTQPELRPGSIIKDGTEVEFDEPAIQSPYVFTNLNIPVLFEDDDILIVNKPKDLVVHPAKGHHNDTLVDYLVQNNYQLADQVNRPGIVHRLDKDTSGCLLIAKTQRALTAFNQLIKNHEVKRKYKALVLGVFSEKEGTIVGRIGRSLVDKKKMSLQTHGKEAITDFKVEEQFAQHALLDVSLQTGRTHQIRVHLAGINHPLLGDSTYSTKLDEYDSQVLHAYSLEFIHPFTNDTIKVFAELPQTFLDALENVKKL
jgi:23S rRNA pseudouridine1911/1915/1917 synthase